MYILYMYTYRLQVTESKLIMSYCKRDVKSKIKYMLRKK